MFTEREIDEFLFHEDERRQIGLDQVEVDAIHSRQRLNDLSVDRSIKREWRQIAGTRWMVSNFGEVRNRYGKSVNPDRSGDGVYRRYDGPRLHITLDGKRKWVYLNRVVLEAFVGPPPGEGFKPFHRDRELNNCALDNLSWAKF